MSLSSGLFVRRRTAATWIYFVHRSKLPEHSSLDFSSPKRYTRLGSYSPSREAVRLTADLSRELSNKELRRALSFLLGVNKIIVKRK